MWQPLLLLLTYHRHLRMISDALELRVEGGQVSYSQCICVISHGYGGFGGGLGWRWWMVRYGGGGW